MIINGERSLVGQGILNESESFRFKPHQTLPGALETNPFTRFPLALVSGITKHND